MSSVTVQWNGGPNFKAALMAGTDQGLAQVADMYVGFTKKSFQRTGPNPDPTVFAKSIKRGGKKIKPKGGGLFVWQGKPIGIGVAGNNVPSKPGEYPARQMGRLAMGIVRKRINAFSYRVGTNVKYANWLEFGTTKMAARPFMIPTMGNLKLRADAQKVLAAAVDRAVKAVLK